MQTPLPVILEDGTVLDIGTPIQDRETGEVLTLVRVEVMGPMLAATIWQRQSNKLLMKVAAPITMVPPTLMRAIVVPDFPVK